MATNVIQMVKLVYLRMLFSENNKNKSKLYKADLYNMKKDFKQTFVPKKMKSLNIL